MTQDDRIQLAIGWLEASGTAPVSADIASLAALLEVAYNMGKQDALTQLTEMVKNSNTEGEVS